MEANTHNCLTCGKPLKGRIDKKFCDDYCRNSFNNRQNSDQNNLVRNVNNVLRKNRRILLEMLGAEGMIKLPKEKLIQQGFNFKYQTHQYVNHKGQVYFFNYEYGYLPLENDWILLVKGNPNL